MSTLARLGLKADGDLVKALLTTDSVTFNMSLHNEMSVIDWAFI